MIRARNSTRRSLRTSAKTGADQEGPAARKGAPLALQWGITTEEKSQALFEAMNDLSQGQYYSVLTPLLIGAWKRKPA